MITNQTLRTIRQRRSIRSFRDEQIKEEELHAILEAGMYAPNAGDQAWHFTVVQNRELLECLNHTAKEAAKQMDITHLRDLGNMEGFNCLYGAPTLIIISGSGQALMPLDADCAAATENMLLAAESLGLGSCWVYFVLLAFHSGLNTQLLKELKMPERHKLYDAAIFGYPKAPPVKAPERKQGLITYIR